MSEVALEPEGRLDCEASTVLDLRAPAGPGVAPSGKAPVGALSAQLTAQFGAEVEARDSRPVLWTAQPDRAALRCWRRQGTCRSEEET
jgi:hypothetical protein